MGGQSQTMKAIMFSLVVAALAIAFPCQGLPESLDKSGPEGDLGNLDNIQEYLDATTAGGVNDELPTLDKRFSPDSVKMALIRAFVKQVVTKMRSFRGRRIAREARPQQTKRELMKARELLRSVDDLEVFGAGLDGHNQMPISSSTATAKLGKVGGSWSLIRSPFGVFRLRPQDPAWIDMMETIGK